MKETYLKPTILLEKLTEQDVITASTPIDPVKDEKENRYVSIFDMSDD